MDKYKAAKNPNTPKEILAELVRVKDDGVRCDVARNPSTPPETLAELAGDKNWWIRYEVALNRNTSKETLTKLAGDKNNNVRYWVAQNPNCPQVVRLWFSSPGFAGLSLEEFMEKTDGHI
jgi:hypothetical protein